MSRRSVRLEWAATGQKVPVAFVLAHLITLLTDGVCSVPFAILHRSKYFIMLAGHDRTGHDHKSQTFPITIKEEMFWLLNNLVEVTSFSSCTAVVCRRIFK